MLELVRVVQVRAAGRARVGPRHGELSLTYPVARGTGPVIVALAAPLLLNDYLAGHDVVAVGLVEAVDEAQCVPCHNSASPFISGDDVFDFDQTKDRDTHEHYALKYEH